MPSGKRAPAAATLPIGSTPPNPPGNPPPGPDAAQPPHQYALLDIIHQAEINPNLQVDAFAGVPNGMFTATRISIVTTAYAEYRMLMVASTEGITLLGLKLALCVTFHGWESPLNDDTIKAEMKMTNSELTKARANLRELGLYAIQRRKKGKFLYTAMMLPMLMRGEELEARDPGFIRNRWDSRDRRLNVSESETSPGDRRQNVSDSETFSVEHKTNVSESETFSLAVPKDPRTLDDDDLYTHHHQNVDLGTKPENVSESETSPGERRPDVSESETSPGDTLSGVDALIAAYQIPPPDILEGTGIPLAEYRPAIAAALLQSGVTPDDIAKAIEEGIPKSKGIHYFPRWLPTAAARERDIRIQRESDDSTRRYARDRENRNALREYRREREREKHRKSRENYDHLFRGKYK